MNKEQFAKYQKELNSCRENELKSLPKLSPKVILSDDLFDASIGDIPIDISLPPQVMKKPLQRKSTKDTKNNPLF